MRVHRVARVGSAMLVLAFMMPANSGALAQGLGSPSPSAPGQTMSPVTALPTVGPSNSDPVATVNTLLDFVIGRRFDQIGPFACADYRATLVSNLDFGRSLAAKLPAGADVAGLVDAITITIPDRSVSVVSNDGFSAVVDLKGTLSVVADQDLLRAWVIQFLQAAGKDTSDASVDAAMTSAAQLVTVSNRIDSQLDLSISDGTWVVCPQAGSSEPSP
jgi:hypothetical protein